MIILPFRELYPPYFISSFDILLGKIGNFETSNDHFAFQGLVSSILFDLSVICRDRVDNSWYDWQHHDVHRRHHQRIEGIVTWHLHGISGHFRYAHSHLRLCLVSRI